MKINYDIIKPFILLITLLILNFSALGQTKIDSLKTVLSATEIKESRLDVLDALTNELVRSNSDEQADYLNEYLLLAKQLEEYDLMAAKSRFLIQYYVYEEKVEKGRRLCDSMLSFKPLFKKEKSEAHLLLKRAQFYFLSDEHDNAIKDYETSASMFLKSGDSIYAADAIYFAGNSYALKSNFSNAIKNYRTASNLYEFLGDDAYVVRVGSEITSLYTQMGFTDKAIDERQRLLERARIVKDSLAIGQLIAQDIVDYNKSAQFGKMNEQLDAFIDFYHTVKRDDLKTYWHHIATIYKVIYHCKTDNKEKANQYFKELEALSENKELVAYLETDLLFAKEVYYDYSNEAEKHREVLIKLSNIKTTSRLESQTNARGKLAKIYKREGKLNQALELQELNAKIKDSVYNVQKTNTFLYYQSEFEAEKKQNELLQQDATIKQLETEKALANTKRNSLIGGLIAIFSALILFFYFRNRQKVKEQAYQNILLNNKIASKTEEINELLTETIQHIKSKERIAKDLKKVVEEEGALNIKSIIADLNATKSDDSRILVIKENIEKVNYEFIKRLSSKFPELTKTEIEICCFLKIGLDRTQIAELRNTSVEAVRKARYRIRKKLSLDNEESLEKYLSNI